jgi:hypothetical protein
LYPSEGIHRRWDSGYRITSTAATWDQGAFVLSVPRRKPADETQETLRTSAFPSTHVKVRATGAGLSFCMSEFRICIYNCKTCSWWVFSVVQEKWSKNLYIAAVSYGRTVS